MEIDHHFQKSMEESQTVEDQLSGTSSSTDMKNGCFECNICLDFVREPIVTLCGHLYCWPCIYKWISHKNAAPRQCPVCKAGLSLNSIVPLYGRGAGPTRTDHECKDPDSSRPDIPQRPSAYRSNALPTSPQQQSTQQRQYQYNHGMDSQPVNFGGSPSLLHSNTYGAFGGMAISVLPWVFRHPEEGVYYSMGSANNPRLRRQEMKAERSLRRISTFLFVCLVFCLLLF